jgi:hypothetical protein
MKGRGSSDCPLDQPSPSPSPFEKERRPNRAQLLEGCLVNKLIIRVIALPQAKKLPVKDFCKKKLARDLVL